MWVPTPWGWLLLLGIAVAGHRLALHSLYDFLAPTEPIGHGLLVVEGWVGDAALGEAIDLWRAGGYARLVTTGGPVERGATFAPFPTYAEQAAAYLRAHGVPDRDIAVVPAPDSEHDRTFVSAVALREWVEQSGIRSPALDLVSEGPHARRSWGSYRLAFGGRARVGIRSGPPDDYAPAAWWRSSAGAKEVLTEAIGWAWFECFFRAPTAAEDRSAAQPTPRRDGAGGS